MGDVWALCSLRSARPFCPTPHQWGCAKYFYRFPPFQQDSDPEWPTQSRQGKSSRSEDRCTQSGPPLPAMNPNQTWSHQSSANLPRAASSSANWCSLLILLMLTGDLRICKDDSSSKDEWHSIELPRSRCAKCDVQDLETGACKQRSTKIQLTTGIILGNKVHSIPWILKK